MKLAVQGVLILGLWLPGGVSAQNLTEPPPLPLMSAELTMARFQRRSAIQSGELASYSETCVIYVELPDTSQHGEYEVQRMFTAPRTLLFKPIRFMGDKFVEVNVIARLLQSEVDHVEKGDVVETAISPTNYKLSYKGQTEFEGQVVHVFQVRPHKKRAGLFKGQIYLEAHTGSLLRAEGRIVK